MKINRFFENEVQGPIGNIDLMNNISSDRVRELMKDLEESMDNFDKNLNNFKTLQKELSNYKSKKSKKNNQIDDTVSEFQLLNKSLEEDIISRLDIIIQQLKDYTTNGERYIYNQ
jgi:Sec-independent protein translocase protein TatA